MAGKASNEGVGGHEPSLETVGAVRGQTEVVPPLEAYPGSDRQQIQIMDAIDGLPRQVQAPSFGVDADLLIGDGIASIEDLIAAVRSENSSVAEEVIRDAVRIVSQRVVDGDVSLLTPPKMDDGRTGAAFSGLEVKQPKVDVYAVKQAVQRHLMVAHMSGGKLPGGKVNHEIAGLRAGLDDEIMHGRMPTNAPIQHMPIPPSDLDFLHNFEKPGK